ncbi:type III secretion system protein SctP (plasmid) [Mycetohabitans rhizoxinica]|uniref:Type III secretion system protein SctP n=1 Tax=Mycetohabitans rhizoxinica TaxID=412963 RepID=A0ABZ2PX56_9BURK
MTSIRHRPVRIIARDSEHTAPVYGRRARPDYASLARRSRPTGTHEDTLPALHHGIASTGLALTYPSGQDADTSDDDSQSSEDGTADASSMVDKRLRKALQPVVAKILQTQDKVMDLVCKLTQEIAAFCGDRSINETGTWDAQLPLDASLLRNTTLNLTLSYSTLSLRFDTDDDDTKQLLLAHAPMLERELGALIQAWDVPRQIQLTVW